MRKDEMIKKLKKCPRNAVLRAHHILAETSDVKSLRLERVGENFVIVLRTQDDMGDKEKSYASTTVQELIQFMKLSSDNAPLLIHSKDGEEVLFTMQIVGMEKYVVLETESDIDMAAELDAQFDHAMESQMDELDFFMELREIGTTLEHIKKYLPDRYEYSKNFMEEHGLI